MVRFNRWVSSGAHLFSLAPLLKSPLSPVIAVLMSLRTGTPNGAGMPHDNDGVTSDFIRQSAILSDLDHPNIVKMVGVFVNIPKGKVSVRARVCVCLCVCVCV